MNDDVLSRVIGYLPRKTLVSLATVGKLSAMDAILGKWEHLLCKCNTIPLRKHCIIYKILMENNGQRLALKLADYTTLSKKRKLALHIYKSMPRNEDLLSIMMHPEFACDAIIEIAAERARRCCVSENALSA